MNLLLVDDEPSMRELLEIVFREEGHRVRTAGSYEDAMTVLERERVDLVISDLRLGDRSGLDLLDRVQERTPRPLFILITAFASADSAIQALQQGAFDYLTKPFDMDELKRIAREALRTLTPSEPVTAETTELPDRSRIIGTSPAMIRIYKTVGVVAPMDSTVLLTGESGTGKEMIARVIHHAGPRRNGPFVSVNCGAFPETLLESELFGYQKGAFTGAVANKKGLFEAAHGGTLFLDEIAETSLAVQVKLLRAIQEKRIRRLGCTDEVEVDARIIAATNRDLAALTTEGRFREDLYYRIAVIPIELPPLRTRREDIPQLAHYFLQRFNQRTKKAVAGFTSAALDRLVRHDWRGNVRELENCIERAVALETTDRIQPERLPDALWAGSPASGGERLEVPAIPVEGLDLDRLLTELERGLLIQALERCGGVQVEAAKLLRVSYRSLRHRLQKLGVEP